MASEPRDFNEAKSIFGQAQEFAAPDLRASFVEEACHGDDALRAEVLRLLEAADAAGTFMHEPAIPTGITTDHPRLIEGPGSLIGPYKLMELIGEGGFGLVFVAEQQRPVRRKVALKIIKPGMDTRDVIARFEAERQALALMDHPNIAKVFDAGSTESGRPYFVMELVRGVPITDYCDQYHLTPRGRLELFVPLCQAIQHAHQKGIVHRDVKPTNVLVTLHDGRPVVKVIDFGVAKALSQQLSDRTIYTQFAQMIGTPLYMSPEQAEMSGLDIDTRSDIYSLGVLLYELLTGATPFDRERLRKAAIDEVRRIFREEEPLKPSTRLSQSGERLPSIAAVRATEPAKLAKLVRGDLDWIVMKCLEKDRNRRYESATGLAHDIERYLNDEPVEASPPSAWYRVRKTIRRNKRSFAAVAAVASALVAGTVVSLYFAAQASFRADEASENLVTARQEKKRADEIARQATIEREQAQDSLVRSLYNEARATLAAGQPGRRWHALDVLQKAEALRTRDRGSIRPRASDAPALPSKSELRSVAVAALMTADARLVRETMISDFNNFVAGMTSGSAGHLAFSDDGSVAAAEFVDLSERSGPEAPTSQRAKDIDNSLQALRVIDVRTGRELLSPTGQSFGHLPGCFALNADGTLLAVGESTTSGVRIKFWNVPEFETPVRVLTWSQYSTSNHPDPRHQLIFGPNGRHLAYVRHGYKQIDAAVWDLETGEEKTFREAQERGGYEGPGAITPDSRSLVIRTESKRMTMLDLEGQNPPSHFELFSASDDLSLFHPRSPWVVNAGGIVWDYRNNRVVAGATPYGVGGGDVAIDSQRTLLAVGSDNGIAVYRLPSAEPVLRQHQPSGAIRQCWTADRRHLVVALMTGALQTWEVALSGVHRVTALEGNSVLGFAFSPDGQRLGVWKHDEARLINVATGESEREYEFATKLVFSLDGERVAVLPSRRGPAEPEPDDADEYATEPMVIVADVATGEELWRRPVQGSVVSASFNRQGVLLAGIVSGKGESGVWDIKANRLVCKTPGGTVDFNTRFIVLSPDGRFVAAASKRSRPSESDNVVVLDVDSGTRIALIESQHHLADIQFSADNRFVAGRTVDVPRFNATGGSNTTTMTSHVVIWKLPEGKSHSELGPYPPFRAPVDVVFSRDSSLITVGRRDGVTEVWGIERKAELFHFQDKVEWGQRSFTPDGRTLAWCSHSTGQTDGEIRGYIEYLDLSILQQELRRIHLDW